MPKDAEANADSDAIQDGQLSTDEQTPSELQALQDAFDKAADVKHSKLDKRASKAEKEAADNKKALSEARTQLNSLIKEKEEEDIKLAADDPDKLTALQLQKKLRERDVEIERMKSEADDLKEQAGKATEVTTERLAETIASKFGVESGVLLTYGGGTEESMTDLAKIIAKNKPTEPDQVPDSGLGGGGASEDAQIVAYAATDSDDHEGIKKILDKYRR